MEDITNNQNQSNASENNTEAPKVNTKEQKAPKANDIVTTVKTAFDPKNRQVILSKKGEKYTVTKESTGFSWTGSEKQAKVHFKHMVNCSQN